jgi:cytochrome P450
MATTRSIAAAAAATARSVASRPATYHQHPRVHSVTHHTTTHIGRSTTVRFKSAPAAAAAAAAAAECPFTGSSSSSSNNKEHPKLVRVPTLPFFGSTLTQYSGTPPMELTNLYEFSRDMKSKFGEFYTYGVPGFGKGLHGILHVITDPHEMLKVIRAEGSHPSGAVQTMWPLVEAFRQTNSPLVDLESGDAGLLGQGERWKAQRTFFQTGMLDPRAAKAYVPGIVAAAGLASKGAPDAAQRNQMNYYLNLCAFDMFSSVMFGELTECAAGDGTTGTATTNKEPALDHARHEENVKFCRAAIRAMELLSGLLMSPLQNMAYKVGYKTQLFEEYMEAWNTVRTIGLGKVRDFEQKYKTGQLNEYERHSYMAHALQRLDEQGDSAAVTHGEVMELSLMALFAGVDTTR